MTTFACGQCGAALSFDRTALPFGSAADRAQVPTGEGLRSEVCPYCASPNIVERPPAPGRPDPRFVVTFTGDAAFARRALDRWLGSRTWFADSALRRARVEDLRGVYTPAYLYSAIAETDFTAQIGEHYTETVTVTVRGADGKEREETRTETRTEHRPLAGRHVGYVTDVLVSASAGLSNAELARIEPYDLKQMRRYSPALVAGFVAEELARPPEECERASRGEAVELIGGQLRRFMPGDSYSDLSWRTSVRWEAMDPILVPVWMFAVRYREDRPPLRVAINGQTGKITGKVPLAWWKIVAAVVVLAAIIAGIVLLVRGHA